MIRLVDLHGAPIFVKAENIEIVSMKRDENTREPLGSSLLINVCNGTTVRNVENSVIDVMSIISEDKGQRREA